MSTEETNRSRLREVFFRLSQGFRKTREESKNTLEGSIGKRPIVTGVAPGEQKGFEEARQEAAHEEVVKGKTSYHDEEKRYRKAQQKEANRGLLGSTIKVFGTLAVAALFCRFAPDLGGAILQLNVQAQEGQFYTLRTGEHGPMTTVGLLDGCKLLSSNVDDRNRVLNFYSDPKTVFTQDIAGKKEGMKEFFDEIQSSAGWNDLSSFLNEKGAKVDYPESVNKCRAGLSEYINSQQGKQQNGLENFKNFLVQQKGFSEKDMQKLKMIIEKVDR